MAVFDWAESRSTSVEESPRVQETRFGDGYVQATPDGLHPQEQTWDLVFDQVDDSIGDDIVSFFRARQGVELFDWTPIWGPAIRVVCKRWRRTRVDLGISTITATFERRYEP
ncbi:phage tail protein [Arenimonas sp.]|uniref:phage tail protein n=1 Tax=Arenimonas sp. TaxID=1872635 RepID=UPI0025C07E91|nr:phage tail protein [Arenimonas sp.]